MSICHAKDDVPSAYIAARCSSAREALVLAMLIYGLAQSCEAQAADQSADVIKNMQPIVGGKCLPMAFVPASLPDEFAASTDLQRRQFNEIDAEQNMTVESRLPSQSLQTTSTWQRLGDYRSQSRVQVLTLWASPRNMVSLQAGKRGGPSLQWSSRVMNRGGATRGLLDRFVASSWGAAGFGSKNTHSFNAAPAVKPSGSVSSPKSP